jgi:hypothetical protein
MILTIHATTRDPQKDLALKALAQLEAARDARVRYDQLLQQAIDAFGDLPMGKSHISGIYAEHFPEDVKDQLRAYARRISECGDAARGIWRESRRRVETLRPWLEYYRRLPDGRVSYY